MTILTAIAMGNFPCHWEYTPRVTRRENRFVAQSFHCHTSLKEGLAPALHHRQILPPKSARDTKCRIECGLDGFIAAEVYYDLNDLGAMFGSPSKFERDRCIVLSKVRSVLSSRLISFEKIMASGKSDRVTESVLFKSLVRTSNVQKKHLFPSL